MHSLREVAKAAARGVAHAAAAPFVLSFLIRAAFLGRDRAIQSSTQLLALVPGLSGQYIRRAFLTWALDACHHTVVVEHGTTFSRAGSRLDERAYIGPGCYLGLVHVGANVLIASGVQVPSGAATHSIDDHRRPIREQGSAERLVRIGAGSWIGASAVVMADVGANSVVGAGAVVTQAVPGTVIAAGVPARVLRTRMDRPARAV